MKSLTLFSPDEPGTQTGGSTEPTPVSPPETSGAATTPATPPVTEPAGRTVSESEWENFERAKAKASESDRFFGEVQKRGFTSTKALLEFADQNQRFRDDPTTARVMEALAQPSSSQGIHNDPQEPLTQQSIHDLMDQRFQEHDAARFQGEYDRMSTQEASLTDTLVGEPDLKAIFGETTYSDALEGKGDNQAAIGFARLLDSEIYKRSPMHGDTRLPVTDTVTMREAKAAALGQLQAIKRMALIEASTHPGDLSTPDVGGGVQPGPQAEAAADDWNAQREAREAAADDTWEASLRKSESSGLPASQT